MIKFLPTLVFLFISLTALGNSDSTVVANDLKPSKGSFVTELNVNPFNGEINLNNSLNQIKLRYFTSENFALRLGFNVKNEKVLLEQNQPYGTNPIRYKDEKSSTTLGLNLGLENHFKGSRRISPYIGVDLSVENNSAKQEIISGQTTTELKNAWYTITQVPIYYQNGIPVYQTITTPSNIAYFSYGLNIFTGFDFYIVKGFFFGYELNLGFNKKSFKEPEVTIIPTPTNNNPTITEYENSSFTFGPKLLNGLRLGYNF